MNWPISAYSTIAGSLSSMMRWSMPMNAPARRMLSMPLSSSSNPTPSVSRLEILPSTSITPSDGSRIPASTWRSVLLPAPLGPMTPSDSPWTIENETSRSAQKSGSPVRFTRLISESRTVCFFVSRRL